MSATLPTVGPGEFRDAMRQLAGAVNVVTSQCGDKIAGMTATAVCSVSAEPPTILVCINRSAATHDVVATSGVFCVNILRAEDWELSNIFGGVGSVEDRFSSRTWYYSGTGAPVLADAICSLNCSVVNKIEHGTHSIFLGQVEVIRLGSIGQPLIYAAGKYAKVVSLDAAHTLPEGSEVWGFW